MENAKKPRKEAVQAEKEGEKGAAGGLSEEALAEAVEKLEEVQDELEKLNEKADEEVLKVGQKYNQLRRPVFDKRAKILGAIPDFWLSVLMSHPLLFPTFSEEDQEALEYLRGLDVEEFPDIKSGHTITLTFAENPFFENRELRKTYKFSEEGTAQVAATDIKWKPGKDLTKAAGVPEENGAEDGKGKGKGKKRGPPQERTSFFKWFESIEGEQEADGLQDDIADVIREDVWPNPLKYYTQEGLEELGVDGDGDEELDEEGEEEDEGDEEEGGDEEEEDIGGDEEGDEE